ncbi:unnamed protein product [Brachionus calyciflorus]|uniref:Uncharacterized protein n=1 Tax=Brachionus calyciflorus TaxID=104777 RepID=A0A814JR85_9BILA|nr:unnamed protein product [Brachionus calyciflorus]
MMYTSLVRPHLEYAIVAWSPYLKKDIKILEDVQRRATKCINGFNEFSYEGRLRLLNLTNLSTRRIRGDLIQMFKVVKNIDQINWHAPLRLNINNYPTRGHSFKLNREIVKNCAPRFNYFTNRVVNSWNKLNANSIEAPSVNSFKAKIDILFNQDYILSFYL